MLKKQNRLSVVSFGRKGNNFSSPSFSLKVLESGEESPRFAFIVSKKVSKGAVDRNRAKRILRDIVEEVLENITSGKDILIFSKKELQREQKEEYKKELTEIFKKAKIYV